RNTGLKIEPVRVQSAASPVLIPGDLCTNLYTECGRLSLEGGFPEPGMGRLGVKREYSTLAQSLITASVRSRSECC
ncbi:MAG TPA: hypothetical protein V6D12_01150, partial [Candidatus Obscuribacterales bacterium]